MKSKRVLTREQAANLVGRLTGIPSPDPATISRWMGGGVRGVKLGGVRIGGRVYTSRDDIETFLRELNADGGTR